MCLPHTADSSMKNSQWITALWRSGDCRMIQTQGPTAFSASPSLFLGAGLLQRAWTWAELFVIFCRASPEGFSNKGLSRQSGVSENCVLERRSHQWFLIYALALTASYFCCFGEDQHRTLCMGYGKHPKIRRGGSRKARRHGMKV